MFETEAELAELKRLLEASFEKTGERVNGIYGADKRLSAQQLAGFRGVKLLAVGTVNAKGEPRVAPRGAAFLHGKFYLAANLGSITVRRLARNPMVAITYFENHLLLMGHGSAAFLPKSDAGFKGISPEWKKAFNGGRDALQGIDVFLRVDATHLVAFAQHPERYPDAWGRPLR
ncbi:MAG: pyridoxamine 5'-phosphate oxidase family protein [Thaumarchaeota archaeon]|nr:pyridoxamine 5'-phosphate oxidase family protein [Nitrososphaerota archaeon]